MASIQAFGDIHGRSSWKMFIDDNFDFIVFIGDYFDNPKINGIRQIENFLEIVDYKIRFPKKIKLLIGNHDLQYLNGIDELYTGWQEELDKQINSVLEDNLKYLQPSFTFNNIIFSHAGLTKSFATRNQLNLKHIDKSLQDLFDRDRQAFQLYGGSIEGDSIDQSPFWVRPKSLVEDKLENYMQVVGHTKQLSINLLDNCAFIDVQGVPLEIIETDSFDWNGPYII